MQVLDHGYVEHVESWGSDERIIEAARMSTAKGFQGWGTADAPGDERLLRFLWEHKHATPFEMAGLVIEVQAPIFVFREWHRHRTQSYNELSARYTPLPDLFYIPSAERLKAAKQSTTNKQGSAEGFGDEDATKIAECLRSCYQNARYNYETLLRVGVAREIARLVIPVAQYSRMRASANLRNWLAFLTLRRAPNAQWEIRQYANAVGRVIKDRFPRTWELFASPQEHPEESLATRIVFEQKDLEAHTRSVTDVDRLVQIRDSILKEPQP
jgi:thymidylate synthase (FAD)